MKVLNRAGQLIDLHFDAIKTRIIRLCDEEMLSKIEVDRVVIATINGIYDGITTSELDDLSSRIAASLQSVHYLYDKLAARILGSNMEKNMRSRIKSFGDSLGDQRTSFSYKTAYAASHPASTLDPEYAAFVAANAAALDAIVDYSRDTELSYFALRTLEKSYLTKLDGAVVESPQDMWMRVAVAIAKPIKGDRSDEEAVADVARIYGAMSIGDYTHATPTLFNAGMKISQCSSCYLLGTDDSLSGIYKTISDSAQISKWAGGIGIHVSNVRAKGARIGSTNGISDGIIPMLQVYNATARYCNQSGRRKGSIAVYLEPWHADVWEFVELKRNTGAETERARDLFLALWVPDEFMRRVEADDDWYLMSPDECPGLVDAYDHTEGGGGPDDFNTLYHRYVAEGKFVKKIKARALWQHIITSQLETGVPYVMYKDHVNRKSNQANVGTIRSSNLCVAPETQILTDKGYQVISELKDQPVKVWNGKQFSDTVVRQTGIDQPLIKVSFSNGSVIECTPYHKFYVRIQTDALANWEGDATYCFKDVTVEAQSLKAGNQISFFRLSDGGELFTEITVASITDSGRTDDTYCFTEPLEGKGVFNGILCGNCAEIVEYSDSENYAVCNLASIAVSKFVKTDPTTGTPTVDHERLRATARQITYNLNRVIDLNFYPTPETAKSNFSMRPIGVGIQGFGDLYCILKLPYDDARAVQLDADVMESIYYGCVEATVELAEKYGPYDRFEGSPASQGKLQFDMWRVSEEAGAAGDTKPPPRWDWAALKDRVVKFGMRNSLLTALMPTATTSQILGNCESFEPFQANVYKRTTLAGEFLVVNTHLMRDLMAIGLWTEEFRRQLLASDGSVQKLDLPDIIKAVYKTVWEVPQRAVIDHAASRGPFVDQSQSMNLFMAGPSFQKLSSALTYGWKSGLKTGVYYLRSQAAVEAIKYGSASKAKGGLKGASPRPKTPKKVAKAEDDAPACRRDDPNCEMCGA